MPTNLATCFMQLQGWLKLAKRQISAKSQESQKADVRHFIPNDEASFLCRCASTVSSGPEVWAPECSKPLGSELKTMRSIQILSFRQLRLLGTGVSSDIIFKELAGQPWLQTWWSRVLGFMHCLT